MRGLKLRILAFAFCVLLSLTGMGLIVGSGPAVDQSAMDYPSFDGSHQQASIPDIMEPERFEYESVRDYGEPAIDPEYDYSSAPVEPGLGSSESRYDFDFGYERDEVSLPQSPRQRQEVAHMQIVT